VPGPNPGPRYTNLLGVAAGAADDIWAVGWANPPFRPKEILTLHWDGAAWTMVPSPRVPSGDHLLTEVAVVAADDVWASGVSYRRRSGDQPLFLHWDGRSWTVVPGPNPGTIGHHSLGIAAPAANDVWAAGTYMNGSGADQTLLLHWDGARWTVVPNPNPGGSGNGFLGVAVVAAGEVWAVGYQCCQGILWQTLTERYAPRLGADGLAPDPAPPIPTAWTAAEAMRRSHQR
jgi:hypothetical protein